MSILRLLSLAAWLALSGCVMDHRNPSNALSVIEAAKVQEGSLVLVRGYLQFGSHARQLWLSKKALAGGNNRNCLTLVETGPHRETLSRNSNRTVVITGTVRSDVLRGVIDYGACNKVGIAIRSVNAIS